MKPHLSLIGNVLFAIATAGLGLAILGLTMLPPVIGYQTYVVLSGSMEPAIHVGSVVFAVGVPPSSLQIGDVITYVRPGDQENVTHRIIAIRGDATGPIFTTKGDANGAPDDADIRYDRLAGKVQLTVPYVGYAFKFIGSPSMRLLFIVVPGMLLLGSWLWEIWRPEKTEKPPSQEVIASMAPPPSEPVRRGRNQPNQAMSLTADAAAVPLRQ